MQFAIFASLAMALVSGPALAAETIVAPFTQPDGAVTAGTYSGVVDITVSGVGQSAGVNYNDAF